MKKVEISRSMIGILYMQVCAERGATDEEILTMCNIQNPSGTSLGWVKVIREADEHYPDAHLPVVCDDYQNRIHYLVTC